MLKKIENIAAASEFKNNTRFTASIHSLPVLTGRKSNASDSLSFSSAFRYLSQLKWHLKSLTHNENDEFLLEFIVDNLTFTTKINIHDCKSSNINYKILNEKLLSSSKNKYEILISFHFDQEVYSEPALASSTEYLNWLFEKLSSYDSILLNSYNNSEVNSFFTDGAEENLRYELSLIHRNIILFVEKVTEEVFSSNLRLIPFKNKDEKLIKILNVNVKL